MAYGKSVSASIDIITSQAVASLEVFQSSLKELQGVYQGFQGALDAPVVLAGLKEAQDQLAFFSGFVSETVDNINQQFLKSSGLVQKATNEMMQNFRSISFQMKDEAVSMNQAVSAQAFQMAANITTASQRAMEAQAAMYERFAGGSGFLNNGVMEAQLAEQAAMYERLAQGGQNPSDVVRQQQALREQQALQRSQNMAGAGMIGTTEAQQASMAALAAQKAQAAKDNFEKAMTEAGEATRSVGRKIVSFGYSATIAGGFAVAGLGMIGHSAFAISDELRRMKTAFTGTPEMAKKFSDAIVKMSDTFGTPMEDQISGAYKFLSSLPHSVGPVTNDKELSALLANYTSFQQLFRVARGMNDQATPEEIAYTRNAVLSQLYPGTTFSNLAERSKQVDNMLINLSQRTATEIPWAGETLKAFGPQAHASGIPIADIAEMMSILAQNKITGSTAGQGLKRFFSREALPTKQMLAANGILEEYGASASLYGKDGKARDPLEMLAQVGKAIEKMPAQQKDAVLSALGGMWNIPKLDTLLTYAARTGAPGMKAEGASLLSGDALGKAFGPTKKEPLSQAANALNALKADLQSVLPLIDSELAKLFGAIQGVAEWFMKLPDPVKKTIVEMVGFASIGTVILGILSIMGGSFVKMAGILLELPGLFKGMGIATTDFGAALKASGSVGETVGIKLAQFSNFAKGMFSEPIVAALRFVGVWVGIPAAIALVVYELVTHWNTVVDWVEHKIPEAVGYGVGKVVNFFGELAPKVWAKLTDAYNAMNKWTSEIVLKAFQAAQGFVTGFTKPQTWLNLWHTVSDFFVNMWTDLIHGAENFGSKVAQSFHRGYIEGTVVNDSMPRQSTHKQTTYGGPKVVAPGDASGNSSMDASNYPMDNPIIDAEKKNQGAKSPAATILKIKSEWFKAVEDLANSFIAKAKASGLKIKEGMIELVNPLGETEIWKGTVGAITAADAAISAAAGKMHAQHLAYSKEIKAFTSDETGAKGLSDTLQDTFDKSANAASEFTQKMDILVRLRKDQEFPTVAELNREYQTEVSYRDKLVSEINRETDERGKLNDKVWQLQQLVANANDKEKQSQEYRDAVAILPTYVAQLNAANLSISSQTADLNDLDKKILTTTQSIDQLSTKLTGLAKAMLKVIPDAVHAAFAPLTADLDTFIAKFSSSFFRGTGLISKSMAGVMQSVLHDLLAGALDNIEKSIVTSLDKTFKIPINDVNQQMKDAAKAHLQAAGAHQKAATLHGTAAQKLSESALKLTQAATDITNAAKGTQVASASATDNQPLDINVATVAGTVVTAVDGIPTQNTGAGTGDKSSASTTDTNQQEQIAHIQKLEAAIGGIVAAYNGYQQGGISGGIQAGIGVYTATGNPWLAAAAALISAFHHVDDPNKMPDKYLPGYQQWLRQNNQPASGGTGITGVETALSALNGNFSSFSQQEQQVLKELQALGPNLGIASEKNGMFTLGSGKQVSVTEYMALINAAKAMFNSDALQQAQNADRLAASFSSLIINGTSGFQMPYLAGGMQGGAIGGNSGGGGGNYIGGPRRPLVPGTDLGNGGGGGNNIEIHLFENATLTETTLDSVRQAVPQIADLLYRTVLRQQYLDARVRGNFVSAF